MKLILVIIISVLSGALAIQTFNSSRANGIIERLSTENQQMRLANNRMTRSRTNFRKPKIGQYDFKRISACAEAVGWPSELLGSIRVIENGGMLLDLGIQSIPSDIKAHYPPSYWQYAAGQRIMVQEAGKMIFENPEVFNIFAHRLATRWSAKKPRLWEKGFVSVVNKYRSKSQRDKKRGSN